MKHTRWWLSAILALSLSLVPVIAQDNTEPTDEMPDDRQVQPDDANTDAPPPADMADPGDDQPTKKQKAGKNTKDKKDKPAKAKSAKLPRELTPYVKYLKLDEAQIKSLAEKAQTINQAAKQWDEQNSDKIKQLKAQLDAIYQERRAMQEAGKAQLLAMFTDEQKQQVKIDALADNYKRRNHLADDQMEQVRQIVTDALANAQGKDDREKQRNAERVISSKLQALKTDQQKQDEQIETLTRDVLQQFGKLKLKAEQRAKIKTIVSAQSQAFAELAQQRKDLIQQLRQQIEQQVIQAPTEAPGQE